MKFPRSSTVGGPAAMPVPIMLYMLQLIQHQTHGDVVLEGVSRTLSQAIDELGSLQRTAIDVMYELEGFPGSEAPGPTTERRRLC